LVYAHRQSSHFGVGGGGRILKMKWCGCLTRCPSLWFHMETFMRAAWQSGWKFLKKKERKKKSMQIKCWNKDHMC